MPTLGQALLRALRAHGAREIFGIPGDFVLPFFKVIEESGELPFFTLSHEPAVGFAADAAARFRGAISVAVATWGAGAFNLVNAVAGAYAERVPVVVVSGAPGVAERASGLSLHHMSRALDTQSRIFNEITCDQAVLDDPARAPAQIARVLRSAREYSLPVYLELPRDLVGAETAEVEVLPPRPPDPDALAECADEILARLRASARPVLLADVEIRRYGVEAKVARLARALGIPVVTSFMGRGLLEETARPGEDALVRGTYMGAAGQPAITALVEDSDALLLLGVILSDTNFAVSQRKIDMRRAMRAFNREVRIGHHVFPDIPMDALIDALLQRAIPPLGPHAPAARASVAYPRRLPADDAPLRPSDVAAAVNDLFDRETPMPIAADMGDCLFTAMEIEHTGGLVAPGYYAGMGYGVPAGLGACVASGARPMILVGDGAFQMTGFELGNCRRYGWDPIVIVFNNASWEMLRVFQPESRFNDLDDWNFAALAGLLGGEGTRVRTRGELAAALARAFAARGRFQLIEAMLPRGETSDTLARFVAGFKAARERK